MPQVTATLTSDGSAIALYTDYRDSERTKAIPGVTRSFHGEFWEMPLGWASCLALRAVFGTELTVLEPLSAWAWREHRERIAPTLALREATDLPPDAPPVSPQHERLRTYQRAGVQWLNTVRSGLLADDLGCGKTVQVSQAMDSHGIHALPALIICPNSMKREWARELGVWNTYAVPYPLEGTLTKRRKALTQALDDPYAAVIVNIESLRQFTRLAPYPSVRFRSCRACDPHKGEEGLKTNMCERHSKELNAFVFRTVVFDEAHRMQDPKAKQTRAAWAMFRQPGVRWRWELTGTPIGDDLGSLWPLLHGIAPEDYPSKEKWLDRYAEFSWTEFATRKIIGVKPERREEFYSILNTRFRRMPKALVLPDLPPVIRIRRDVEMTPRQKKAYDELSGKMITRMDDGTLLVTPDNLVKHLRMLQLSSSYGEIVKDDPDDADTWHVVLKEPSPKVDEVMEILNGMDPSRQVAVCAVSSQLVDMAARRMEAEGIPHVKITGAVNEAGRAWAMEQLQTGKTRVMLFTMAAGGTGLTMTAADTLICMQRSYRMIDNIQTEGRVHRIGSERHESVTVIDLVTTGTVEETDQIPALQAKFERLEEINRDRETLRAAGKTTDHLDAEEASVHAAYL